MFATLIVRVFNCYWLTQSLVLGTITLFESGHKMSDGGVGNAISSSSRNTMGRRR